MIWRLFGVFVWQLAGAAMVSFAGSWFALGLDPILLALIGAIGGGFAWVLLHLMRAARVLTWLREGDLGTAPQCGGVWGEATDRIRRLLRQHVQNTQASDRRLNDFLSAIQASPSGVLLLDAHGQIEWCNLTAANHFGDVTLISNAATDNKPGAVLFITLVGSDVVTNQATGVVYNVVKNQWSIFNEDNSSIADSENFNVLVFPGPIP